VLESRNAEFLFVLTSLRSAIVLGNGYFSVSGQTALLVSVGDVDRWTVLISQKGGVVYARPGSLGDVINCGVGWL